MVNTNQPVNHASANARACGQIIFVRRQVDQTPGQRPTIRIRRLQGSRVPEMRAKLNLLRAQLESFALRSDLSEQGKRMVIRFRQKYDAAKKRVDDFAKIAEGLSSRSSAIILQDIPEPSTSRGNQQRTINQSQAIPEITQNLINTVINRIVNVHKNSLHHENSLFTTNRLEFKRRVREALKIKLLEFTDPNSIPCIICCEKSVDVVLCHDDCSICIHTCLTCIQKWASINNSCPTCRKRVTCIGDLVKFLKWTQKPSNSGH